MVFQRTAAVSGVTAKRMYPMWFATLAFEPYSILEPVSRHLVPTNRMTGTYFEQRAYAQGISDSYYDHSPQRWRGKVLSLVNAWQRLADCGPVRERLIRSLACGDESGWHASFCDSARQ